MIPKLDEIKEFIENNNSFVIVQADNPDGDSLATALALENILSDMGKTVNLYCGVEMPNYLKFLNGWEKIDKFFLAEFDATIIVDTSANNLLEKLNESQAKMWVASKPVLVFDHHSEVECDIPYASIVCNPNNFASTGELVYEIAKKLKWPISKESGEFILQSILSDSLGLTSDIAGPKTYQRVSELLDMGIKRSKLEEARRELSKMDPEVFRYKAKLIERTEFFYDNKIAVTIIPENESYDVGTLYNPGPLIISELLNVSGVKVAIVLKTYTNKLTGSIRCVSGVEIASDLAKAYGGGGHPYAAGFKIEKFKDDITEFKYSLVKQAFELLK
ncbi:DHH family phosphoesterase [Candidatus Saccharibacteria bacterium]|jgi:phosphoesterase RecJ-like protein|nr:DHH family phosphoesterase [Candidatus Saccharibacteria bacterium]MBP7834748.1 DHH family phosphoesterase [Candidatus Saccharibacteria bacterium]